MKKRLYLKAAKKHFKENRQMLFLMGPRQVGKTTISQELLKSYSNGVYINWDNPKQQQMILEGGDEIAELAKLDQFKTKKSLIIFDEIHKFNDWKNFIKGFFDTYEKKTHILVTGSTRIDTYRKSGDSLMGRYFVMRMHPLSAREVLTDFYSETPLAKQRNISNDRINYLMRYGGFPEPYLKRTAPFYQKWKGLRHSMLFREEIRDLTKVQEVTSMELLAELLRCQAGEQTTYSSLAKKMRKGAETVRRWIDILKSFYYCFEVRPWSKNVTRSLLKEPKFYLWDWSLVDDKGFLYENLLASHLLKAVHFWNDCGLGEYGLYYLRDKEQREVDFILTKNQEPWILVEAKISEKKQLSSNLSYFQKMLNAPHAFQVVLDMPFVNRSCFEEKGPIKVPAKTFLSQLV